MPSLSPTMEQGNIVKWLKKEGEQHVPNVFPAFLFDPVVPIAPCFDVIHDIKEEDVFFCWLV